MTEQATPAPGPGEILEASVLEADLEEPGSDPAASTADPEAPGSDQPSKRRQAGNGTRAPWGFKSFPFEEKNAAINRAAKHEMPVQDWVALAIRTRIQFERDQETAPAVVPGEGVVDHTPLPALPPPSLEEVEKMIGMAKEMSDLTMMPPPVRVSALVYRHLQQRLAAGFPVRPRKPRVRPAMGQVRPTRP